VEAFSDSVLSSSSAAHSAPPSESAGARAVRDRAARRRRHRLTPEGLQPTLDEGAKIRLGLQRGSERNLSRQFKRSVVRVGVLVAADLGAFYMMRALIRSVRDDAVFGSAAADFFAHVLPRGYMNGWQFAVALLVGLVVTGNYGTGDARRDAGRLFAGSALAAALPLWMSIWSRGLGPVLIWYAAAVLLVWLGMLVERLSVNRVVALVRPPERDAPRTVFVGPAEKCRRAAALPVFSSGKEYRAVGFLDRASPPAADALGSLSDLARVVQDRRVETVVICGHFRDGDLQHVVDTGLAAGCELVSIPRTPSMVGLKPTLVWRGGEPLVALTASALKAQQLVAKRAIDVAGSLVGLLLLSPLFAAVGVLIRLESPGPAFFRQQRVGFGGRPFRIVKFRTMRADAEVLRDDLAEQSIYSDPRLFKIKDDPRLTRLGRWLRRTSIDELPQLWNVLRGEMSLVGPRPPLLSEVQFYSSHHYSRFDVKPGITGPWQVSGRNAVKDFEQVVRLEREYAGNWSLVLDLRILLRTVPVVFSKRGAY